MRPMTSTRLHLLCDVKPYWHIYLRGPIAAGGHGINWVGTRPVTEFRNAMSAKFLATPTA